MTEVGRKKIGMDSEDRRGLIKNRIRRRAEQSMEKSRRKILELRRRYKMKVERNEEKMKKRKKYGEKLGPTCVSLMESREKEKQKRSAIGSLVPEKPKFSQALSHAPRIYGKRFELFVEGALKRTEEPSEALLEERTIGLQKKKVKKRVKKKKKK